MVLKRDGLRIVHISDTHGHHKKLNLPKGDVLVHSGDICALPHQHEIEDFFAWFMLQPHTYKILVTGNRDLCFDNRENYNIHPLWLKLITKFFTRNDGLNFILNDNGCEILGVKFWGSSYLTKRREVIGRYAFDEPDREINMHWDLIPKDTDVLVTHTPPYGKLDKAFDGVNAGCKYLRFQVKEKKPKLHLFGHIHEEYGMMYDEDTMFVNGSVTDRKGEFSTGPHLMEVDFEDKQVRYNFGMGFV